MHPFPFQPSAQDAAGTDRIMVVSGHRQASGDGYTADTVRPDNAPRPLTKNEIETILIAAY